MKDFNLYCWEKIGVIPFPQSNLEWINSHCYIPTPILINNNLIRIFVAFWDKHLIGRIGFIDVEANDPLSIINFSKKPCLDVGVPGAFDDKGVSPLSIIKKDDTLYLFYAGWQRVEGVRYLLFTGLATSNNDGETFIRKKTAPILERTDSEFIVRSGAGVVYDYEEDLWKMIYAGGSNTFTLNGKVVPTYNFNYTETKDPWNWPKETKIAIRPNSKNNEFGFGRPFIKKFKKDYEMLYGIRNSDIGYTLGYARSKDMINWERMDEKLSDFNLSTHTFDKNERFAPWVLATENDIFLFYNGNDYGREGVCVAKAIKREEK